MNYEIVNLNEKIIAGISARTGNSDPECQKIIGGLWQDFMGKGIWDSMKNKANEYCICRINSFVFVFIVNWKICQMSFKSPVR